VRLYSSNLKQLRQNIPRVERRLMLLVDLGLEQQPVPLNAGRRAGAP